MRARADCLNQLFDLHRCQSPAAASGYRSPRLHKSVSASPGYGSSNGRAAFRVQVIHVFERNESVERRIDRAGPRIQIEDATAVHR